MSELSTSNICFECDFLSYGIEQRSQTIALFLFTGLVSRESEEHALPGRAKRRIK